MKQKAKYNKINLKTGSLERPIHEDEKTKKKTGLAIL